jgi:hypothetical protein
MYGARDLRLLIVSLILTLVPLSQTTIPQMSNKSAFIQGTLEISLPKVVGLRKYFNNSCFKFVFGTFSVSVLITYVRPYNNSASLSFASSDLVIQQQFQLKE